MKLRLMFALALAVVAVPGFMAQASNEDSTFAGFAVLGSSDGESLSIQGISRSDGDVEGTATYTRSGVVWSISLECVEFEPGSETHTMIGGDMRASGLAFDPLTGEPRIAHIRVTGTFGRLDSTGRVGISWDVVPEGMCGADNVVAERPEFGQFLFVRPVLSFES